VSLKRAAAFLFTGNDAAAREAYRTVASRHPDERVFSLIADVLSQKRERGTR